MATKAHGFEELSAAAVCRAATLGYRDPQERLGLGAWYVYMGLWEGGQGQEGCTRARVWETHLQKEAKAALWEQVVPGLPGQSPGKSMQTSTSVAWGG